MQGRFWMGFLVGFLVGVVATGVAIVLWLVPVRSSTVPVDPSSAPAGVPVGIEAPLAAGLGSARA